MLGFFERRLDPFRDDIGDADVTPPSTLVGFCWFYVREAWPWLLTLALLTAATAVTEVVLFGFLGQIVDWLAAADRATFLADEGPVLAAMAGLLLVGLPAAVTLQSLVLHQVLLGNLPMAARWRMHRRLLGQSMDFFATEFAGRVATRLMQTALAVRETVIRMLDVFVYVFVYFLAMIALVASADWRLALPIGVWAVIYGLILRVFVPRVAQVSERQADARAAMTGRIVDSYTNIATVKLFAHAGREESYARDSMRRFLATVHPQMRLVTGLEVFLTLNNVALIFAISALGIGLWLEGALGLGAIAVGIALAMRIHSMSGWVMWEVSQMFENIGIVSDGMSMMSRPRQVRDVPDARPLRVEGGAISFDRVRFHYGKAGGVIENLSLEVAPGEKVGLVGRSGAGKSTLVNLLLRFHDLEGGTIRIDGQDISRVTQDSLRGSIGMVTQDTSLLHRSIRDNIAYGRPGATDADIRAALRRADAGEFVDGLVDPQGRRGLDAHVGERGVRLSGGQRQRIAIARIFLKNAPILVLDEATSALDSEAEAAIQSNFAALMEGKTVIAIAHRLSTIAAMDRLIVLDRGAIVEEGRHDALVAAGGLYADLWARQSGGFLPAALQGDDVDAIV